MSTFHVGKPTLKQYELLPRLTLTSADLTWDPQTKEYEQAEAAMLNLWRIKAARGQT
jgi:hypothetical protein